MSATLPWYVARSCGLVAWALLTASVVWGLILSTKVLGMKPRPAWVLDLHRYLGGLGVVFSGVHIGAILLDSYVSFSPVNVLIPMTSSWRPGAVSWGVVSLYLLLAVQLTSLLRHRLPRKAWRYTHALAFPLYLTASIHAFTSGTDSLRGVVRPVSVLTVTAVLMFMGWRLMIHRRPVPARVTATRTAR